MLHCFIGNTLDLDDPCFEVNLILLSDTCQEDVGFGPFVSKWYEFLICRVAKWAVSHEVHDLVGVFLWALDNICFG